MRCHRWNGCVTGPIETRLATIADRMGWRLRWKARSLPYTPRLMLTELDIFSGKQLLTRDGSVWVITGGKGEPREDISRKVIEYLRRERGGVAKAA